MKLLQSKQTPPFRAPASNDLIGMLLAVTRNPTAFQLESMDGVRLWACLLHPMTAATANRLKMLKASGTYGQRRLLSRRRTSRFRPYRQWFAPRPAAQALVTPASLTDSASSSAVRSHVGPTPKTFVRQGLQLLFPCEYLLLLEYVECVVPLVFAVYKSIAEHLPNIIYYPGGAGDWSLSALINILVFAAMEAGRCFCYIDF